MNEQSNRRSRLGLALAVVGILLVAVLFGVLHRKELVITRAMDQLQLGMTDAEVRQVLEPVRYGQLPGKQGVPAYLFYGCGEFVTVIMENDGDETRLAKIVRQPDEGPVWDRLRRSWENRLR